MRKDPTGAVARYRLALSETDAGLFDRAEESWRQVLELSGPEDSWQGESLHHLAQVGWQQVLLERAEQAQREGHRDEAVKLLGRAASAEFPAAARVEAVVRQARLWEAAGQPVRAVQAWQTLLADAALRRLTLFRRDMTLPQNAAVFAAKQIADRKVRQVSAQKLQEPGFPSMGVSGPTGLFVREWQTPAEVEERLLPLADEAGASGREVFFVRKDYLVCREGMTGVERWSRPAAGSLCWAGCHGDCVVVAGPDGMFAFAVQDGQLLWEFQTPKCEILPEASLSGFQLVEGRVYCLQGEARLLALDAATGEVLWEHWAPSGRIDPNLPDGRLSPHFYVGNVDQVGPTWILCQTAGRVWCLWGGPGGRTRTLETGETLWSQAPLPLGENRFCLVEGHDQVVLYDAMKGVRLLEAPAGRFLHPDRRTAAGTGTGRSAGRHSPEKLRIRAPASRSA